MGDREKSRTAESDKAIVARRIAVGQKLNQSQPKTTSHRRQSFIEDIRIDKTKYERRLRKEMSCRWFDGGPNDNLFDDSILTR